MISVQSDNTQPETQLATRMTVPHFNTGKLLARSITKIR